MYLTDVKIIPATDPRLGRVVEHDPRSRHFAFLAPEQVTLVTKRHKRWIDVLNQGNLGSCTGNSGIGAMGTSPFYEHIKDLHNDWSEAAAVQLYSEATVADSFPGSYLPDDTGSSGLAIAKILVGRGWISGYRHTFTLYDMQAALQDGPVLVGINWYGNFFNPNAMGELTIGTVDKVEGGHEIVCDEIDMEKKRFGFTNSWGTNWGQQGRFYISFELMERLLKEDGDVVVPVPLNQPAPEPTPEPYSVDKALWTEVESWAKARHTGSNKRAAASVSKWAQSKGLTA